MKWIRWLHAEWDKTNNPCSFDAQHLSVHRVTRHLVAWYRPETKVWMKPELDSLISVAMTTAPVSSASQRLHPLGEFTDSTWQPKFYIITLFRWEHERRRYKQTHSPSVSILFHFSCSLIHIHPCPVWPFHSARLDVAEGVLLLLAGAKAGCAGCSLNATPPSFCASLSEPTADSLSHAGSSVKRFCLLCTCSHLILPKNTVRSYWGRVQVSVMLFSGNVWGCTLNRWLFFFLFCVISFDTVIVLG